MAGTTLVQRQTQKRSEELKEKTSVEVRQIAKKMYLSGITCGRIGKELGVALGTVRAWSTRYRWVREQAEIREAIVNQISGNSENPENIVNEAVQKHEDRINRIVSSKLDRLDQIPIESARDLPAVASALKTFDDVARRNLGMSTQEAPSMSFGIHLNAPMPARKADRVVDV